MTTSAELMRKYADIINEISDHNVTEDWTDEGPERIPGPDELPRPLPAPRRSDNLPGPKASNSDRPEGRIPANSRYLKGLKDKMMPDGSIRLGGQRPVDGASNSDRPEGRIPANSRYLKGLKDKMMPDGSLRLGGQRSAPK
jgi:hypothetical protein